MNCSKLSRRQFLVLGTSATSALLLPTIPWAATPSKASFDPDLWIELTAAPHRIALRPGPETRIWSFQARVRKGDPSSVQAISGSYLGPTLRMRRGQKVRIDFANQLGESSIVHWHGLHVPDTMDGHPRFAIETGKCYRYEFEVCNRAGTYWYHPHPHGQTGAQVYFGLAGLLLVSDKEEQAVPLPRGKYDVPLVIQDRLFDDDNQLRYMAGTGPSTTHKDTSKQPSTTGHGMMTGSGPGKSMMGGRGGMAGHGGMSDMHIRMMGFLGDTILVNGKTDTSLEVATHPYRLRILNGSNARIYKLAWQDGRPLIVVGTDGGLLEQPVHKDYVMLAPGERIELWADFSKDSIGTELTLMNLAFDGSMGTMGHMMRGMMGGTSLAPSAKFPIFQFKIARQVDNTLRLPQKLSTITWPERYEAVNRDNPRRFHITMAHMQWGINGRSFEMTAVAPDETVKLNTIEIWEFVNDSRMMAMAYSMHVHNLQFRVLERHNGSNSADVKHGYIDQGWQDTVLVMPGDRIRLLMRFEDYSGLYLYHCHMLEHEDAGLMRNYRVET
jgi:FtsP/CotA-like multicopper oxidase with cupredoxin domain